VHTRSLRFPESCDMSKIDAKFKDGSLCVKIAKKPEAKTHRIQIGGGQQAQQIEAGGA
jgi:HSP20 family molecular chaperone IbpA